MNFGKTLSCCAVALVLSACGAGSEGEDANKEVETPFVDHAPLITLQQDTYTVEEKSTLAISVDAVDEEGTVDGFEWTQLKGVKVELSDADTDTVTVTFPETTQPEVVELQVSVVDDQGNSAAAVIVVEIEQITRTMTVEGVATDEPLNNATITLMLDGEETEVSTTTDNMGNYRLPVTLDDSELTKFVSLKAIGSDNQVNAGLISLMGHFDALIEAAGEDEVLTKEEDNATTISHITTAKYGLMLRESEDGNVYSEEAIKQLSSNIDYNEMLALASAIKVGIDFAVFDQALALPDGAINTLELVEQQAAFEGYLQKVGETEEFAQAKAATIDDPALLDTGYVFPDAFELYITYDGVATSGTVGRGTAFQLYSDGTGRFSDVDVTWEASGSELTIYFPESSYYETTEYLEGYSSVSVLKGVNRYEFKVVDSDDNDLELLLNIVSETIYPNGESDPTTKDTGFITPATLQSEAIHNADSYVAYLPLTSVDTQYYGIVGMDTDNQYALRGDKFMLSSDGTGVGEKSLLEVTWDIVEGELVLNYVASGRVYESGNNLPFEKLTYKKVKDAQTGMLVHSSTKHAGVDAETFGEVDVAGLNEEQISWNASELAGIYGFEGLFGNELEVFYIQLEENGHANFLSTNDGDGNGEISEVEVFRAYGTWGIQGNELVIKRFSPLNESGIDINCRAVTDTCRLEQERKWELVDSNEQMIFVLNTFVLYYDYVGLKNVIQTDLRKYNKYDEISEAYLFIIE